MSTAREASPSPTHHASFPFSHSYDWRALHSDLERGHFIGTYGADNAAYHGLAGIRAGIDMSAFHSRRSPDEFLVEPLQQLIDNPVTQERWASIITIDPLGMFATRPTMSATEACMVIPELQAKNQLEADGRIVKSDLSINCTKCAIDLVWNLPRLAERLSMDEQQMRAALASSTQNPQLLDGSRNAYLPPVGGITVYFFGDISKLQDRTTEVAVRVHDECSGSDVFGTDICTCRPYLIFALQAAVQCAQRGGVGLIIYFRKEGRSLGEVTKFRVYNARKRQQGGDTAANYFKQTEGIAGIRDARFQEMMPDVLLWLGLTRIDWLLSMSSEKYDAITAAGIEVMQRVSLPDVFVPKAAVVEITAKISAGYHSEQVHDHEDVANELRSLEMVRERCGQIFELARQGKSKHFRLDLSQLERVVDYVWQVTVSSYGGNVDDIPYHSRWRHFKQSDVKEMIAQWRCDPVEKCRRLVDLATISVLLDAGAGSQWKYRDQQGVIQERSEGLAIATFDMFRDGVFSSDPALPHRVNGLGLKHLTLKTFTKGLQVSDSNPIAGLEGRFKLVKRIGRALMSHPQYFGYEVCRPGHMVDWVLQHVQERKEAEEEEKAAGGGRSVSLRVLWEAVSVGLEDIWPQHLNGIRNGDVFSYSLLKKVGKTASDLVPFHKLSQWLTYSLLEPMEELGIRFTDLQLLTALAEYRNGGLMLDMHLLTPRRAESLLMEHDAGSELVVEWRALTVVLVDMIWERLCTKIGKSKEQFPLAKVLQGGTWAAGRLIANEERKNRSSPIVVRSDGTVF